MGEPILKIISLKKSYRIGSETVEVLKDVSLNVREGTTVVVTGESGSGKTTLLNLTGGLDTPSAGHIYIDSRDISRLDEDELTGDSNSTIGFIFEFHFLLKDFDALENVLMPAYLRTGKLGQARNRATNLLKEVGLEKRAHHFPSELSGGERQRVAVARALMNDPGLILADEPTGNLDERNSSVIEDLLFELVEKYRKTLLLMTHDKYIAGKAHEHYELLHGELVSVSTA